MNKNVLALALLAGSAGPALADHPPAAEAGGRLAEAHGHRMELVTREGMIEVLLKDEHNRPMAADGFAGKAVVMAPGGKADVPLAPADTRLTGSLPAGAELAATILALKAADGHAMNARFPALPPVEAPTPALVAQGKAVYDANCASCHGDKLQGQDDWKALAAKGEKAAPALDATGHGWHHSDADLVAAIRQGAEPMPAFDGTLSDEEIDAVLAYFKSSWPIATLAQQPRQAVAAPMPRHAGHDAAPAHPKAAPAATHNGHHGH